MGFRLANTRLLRILYEKIDWANAGQVIEDTLGRTQNINLKEELDSAVKRLVSTIAAIVYELTPTAEPCLCCKRWFGAGLTEH